MGISHLLEDFGGMQKEPLRAIDDASLEEIRLDAYESGYKAGWDDAASAQDGDSRRISADFAANLSALSFTYEEAFQAMLRDLRPVLETAATKILPMVAQDTLRPRVVELLHEAVATGTHPSVEMHVSEENAPALEDLAAEFDAFPVSIVPESTLAPGQVHFKFGTTEREIDLEGLIAEIRAAVGVFFDTIDAENNRESIA